MKTIKTYFISLICIIACTQVSSAIALPNECIDYKVIYKWGLIHKQAGTARILLNRSGNFYSATATGKSAPWADKFYKLRDTLHTTMHAANFMPIRYEYIAHEDGKYSHDIVNFSQSGNTVTGKCSRVRKGKKDKTATKQTTTLTAQGMTVDMLSSYFSLRSLDFDKMSPGAKKRINIFSGKRKEYLTFTYVGTQTLDFNGKKTPVYKVVFTFTSDGKKESSDPIEAWVSTDNRRIPLKLIGKLKIGQVQCIYQP